MRAARRAAAFAAIGLAAACGGADRMRGPGEPVLQIWAPTLVWWDPGQPRRLDFAIENPTSRTVALAAPDAANARVELYGPESYRLCSVTPAPRAAPAPRVALAPGDRWPVRVDLGAACGAIPAGEWRYEVSYRAPEPASPAPSSAPGGARTFTGALPVRYGQIIVAPPQAAAACEPPRAPAAGARQGRSTPAARGRGRSAPTRRDPAAAEEP